MTFVPSMAVLNQCAKSCIIIFVAANTEQQQHTHYFLFFSRNKISAQVQDGNCTFFIAGTDMQLGSTPVSLSYIKQYIKVCNQFDIIHVHIPNPVAFFAIYLKQPKGKVIVHWHSDIVKQKLIYPYFRLIEKKVLQQATSVIATSQNYADGSKPLAPYSNKIHVIPIGIESIPIHTNNRSDKQVIASVGRLVYYKGFEYLIKAAQFLPDDYEIKIAGNGELKVQLEELINSLQLSHKVKLLGYVSDEELNSLLNECKVFCLPSIMRSEAFGVVLLEALRLGKPIVATNIAHSGVNWVNEHNVTGLNVEIKNDQQLAKALITVLSDEMLYKQFSENAVNRFNTLFTANKMNVAIYKLYCQLSKQSAQLSKQQI